MAVINLGKTGKNPKNKKQVVNVLQEVIQDNKKKNKKLKRKEQTVKKETIKNVNGIDFSKIDDTNIRYSNIDEIDKVSLMKLPLWDNFQRWENLVTIGLIYASDISQVDPVANGKVKELIESCESLYKK